MNRVPGVETAEKDLRKTKFDIDKTKKASTIWKMSFDSSNHHPLASLPREDLDLIAQLVLHSGSLKDLAASYDVSYPTIRTRLDRVISRLRQVLAGRRPDPMAELLARLLEQGELTPSAARAVRELARTLHPAPTAPLQGERP